MPLSLPIDPPSARSLAAVLPELLRSLSGRAGWFAPARSAIVFVVDGLGAQNLSARAGHARFLAGAGGRRDVARTVFPATTAVALTSLLTASWPGEHGIVGYRARVPGTDRVPNQLKGWEREGLDPLLWQRMPPLLAREAGAGRPCFVVSRSEYGGSGFTTAVLRGAEFVGVDDLRARVAVAAQLAGQHPGALVYLYAADLDVIGHRHGWESDQWAAGLERVDAAAQTLSESLASGVGAVVLADHGMVDVPRHRQVLLAAGDDLLDGVMLIGGEPRMLHLYAAPGRAGSVRDTWRRVEGSRAWVLDRDEAVAAGLFGPRVHTQVRGRIGDVLVAARADVAYYDDREADKASQRMVGQHGSLTPRERIVPLIRLGAFA